MDFSRFKLFDCFEAASIKQWARETLPTIPPPPFSSGARREMEAIIAEKANLVERLLEKVNVELEELVKCSAIISPYRMIPHEILGNIINVPYLEADALMLNPRRRCRPSTHLTVCMSWSQVALSQPRIWSHIDLAVQPYASGLKYLQHLEKHLSLSKSAPLHMSNGPAPKYFLRPIIPNTYNSISPHLGRLATWRENKDNGHITLFTQQPRGFEHFTCFDNLRYLCMSDFRFENSLVNRWISLPALHTLEFVGYNASFLSTWTCPILKVIGWRHIDIEQMFTIFDVLERFETVKYLTVSDSRTTDLGDDIGDQLQRISHLNLTGPSAWVFRWEPLLDMCSSLTEISISNPDFIREMKVASDFSKLPGINCLRVQIVDPAFTPNVIDSDDAQKLLDILEGLDTIEIWATKTNFTEIHLFDWSTPSTYRNSDTRYSGCLGFIEALATGTDEEIGSYLCPHLKTLIIEGQLLDTEATKYLIVALESRGELNHQDGGPERKPKDLLVTLDGCQYYIM